MHMGPEDVWYRRLPPETIEKQERVLGPTLSELVPCIWKRQIKRTYINSWMLGCMARDGFTQGINGFRIAFNSPEEDTGAIGVYRSCAHKALTPECLDRRTQDPIVVLARASKSVHIMDLIGTSQSPKVSDLSEMTPEYNTPQLSMFADDDLLSSPWNKVVDGLTPVEGVRI